MGQCGGSEFNKSIHFCYNINDLSGLCGWFKQWYASPKCLPYNKP